MSSNLWSCFLSRKRAAALRFGEVSLALTIREPDAHRMDRGVTPSLEKHERVSLESGREQRKNGSPPRRIRASHRGNRRTPCTPGFSRSVGRLPQSWTCPKIAAISFSRPGRPQGSSPAAKRTERPRSASPLDSDQQNSQMTQIVLGVLQVDVRVVHHDVLGVVRVDMLGMELGEVLDGLPETLDCSLVLVEGC